LYFCYSIDPENKKMKIPIVVIAVLSSIIIFSCTNKNGSFTDVYISGTLQDPTYSGAVYWKNRKPVPVTSLLNNIIVSGNDIYTLGSDFYAKNGIVTTLPNAMGTTGFFVDGADVYVTGYTAASLSTATAAAIYWKNGVQVNLTQSTDTVTAATTYAVFVSNGDVYVAGIIGINYRNEFGVYWKNGNRVSIPNAYMPKAIAVSGNNIYVAGSSLTDGDVYWINGAEQILGGAAIINSMVVSGTDVYLAGYSAIGPNQAAYWKNGVAVMLPNGSDATGIAVSGNTVYTCGNGGYNDAVYWKNSVIDTLGSGTATGIALGH
jgi:hypothetical protein